MYVHDAERKLIDKLGDKLVISRLRQHLTPVKVLRQFRLEGWGSALAGSELALASQSGHSISERLHVAIPMLVECFVLPGRNIMTRHHCNRSNELAQ